MASYTHTCICSRHVLVGTGNALTSPSIQDPSLYSISNYITMKPPYTIAPLLSCLLLSLATCYEQQQQSVLSAQPLLRNASASDADAIANVIIAAFSPTPSWQYLYQFRDTHPQEHHRCARSNVLKALADASYRVEVIEAPVESSNSTTRVAAVAMWRHNAWQEGLMFLSRLSGAYTLCLH
jgi:hypothetical protein